MATANAIIDESKRTADLKNIRSGLGNNTLFRDSFRTPSVIGRQATDFALQELIDQQQQGIKVQLSDKTLNEMFQVATPDDKDVLWIAEYNRRLGEGETKEQLKDFPPFGRAQRTIFKSINFGQGVSLSQTLAQASSKTITEQLTLIKDAVTGGSSTSDLPQIMAKIIELCQNFEAFTTDNDKMLAEILNASKVINPDPEIFFGTGKYHRIWSRTEVRDSSTFIPFIKANVPSTKHPLLSPSEPVIGPSGRITLKRMLELLDSGASKPVYNSANQRAVAEKSIYGDMREYKAYNYYLDIDNRKLITRDEAIALVTSSLNVDNGLIDGLQAPSFTPIGSSLDVKVVGKWLLDADNADLESKASTSKMPPPKPKPEPKPPPKPEPPRDPSVDKKKTDKEASKLFALAETNPKLPTTGAIKTFKASNPDDFHKKYAVDDPRTKQLVDDYDIFKVGDKWYRRGY
jgi:hypothetical protein